MITQAGGIVSFVFTIIFFGIVRAEECGQMAFMQCTAPLQDLTGTPDLSFAVNKEELDKKCQKYFAAILCINRHARQCMSLPSRMHFNSMFHEINNVLRDLCHEGAYQEEFLRHAPCMRTVKEKFTSCTRTYNITINTIGQQKDSAMTHQNKEFIECSAQAVRRTCGDEAATFESAFLRRITSNIIESHCQEYQLGKCRLLNSRHRQSSSLWFKVLLTLRRQLAKVFRDM